MYFYSRKIKQYVYIIIIVVAAAWPFSALC